MKPHIRRYFINKRTGWGWAVYSSRQATKPERHTLGFKLACIAALILWEQTHV